MTLRYASGATSISVDVQIVDDSGLPVTGLVAATFPTVTISAGTGADAAVSLSDLAALTTAYSGGGGGVKERGNGVYRLDVPNQSDGAFTVRGEASGKHLICPRIQIGNITAASVVGSVGSVVGAVGSVTGNVGGNVVGSAASVSGSVGSVAGNVGGNVVGSVASVVGAVGSVAGAVGSVTGNVGGNVVGSTASVSGAVGSVTGAVGSVTGNVGGNVVGSTASVSGNVVGSVGSVTGAVGSVTGGVGGNVTGSVGSVAGSVGSVTGSVGSVAGSVGGDVTGKVRGGGASALTGDGVQAASVSGSVGSVTGAVGSVTGAVGSVAGAVGGDVDGRVLGGGSGTITGDGVRASSVTGSVGSVVGATGSVTGNVGGDVAGKVLGGGSSSITGVGAQVSGGGGSGGDAGLDDITDTDTYGDNTLVGAVRRMLPRTLLIAGANVPAGYPNIDATGKIRLTQNHSYLAADGNPLIIPLGALVLTDLTGWTLTFTAQTVMVRTAGVPDGQITAAGAISVATGASQAASIDLAAAAMAVPYGDWAWNVTATKGASVVELRRGLLLMGRDYEAG